MASDFEKDNVFLYPSVGQVLPVVPSNSPHFQWNKETHLGFHSVRFPLMRMSEGLVQGPKTNFMVSSMSSTNVNLIKAIVGWL